MWNVRIFALLAALVWPAASHAQTPPGNYPDKPVKVVVPFAAGGPTHVVAPLIATQLSEPTGKQFYVQKNTRPRGQAGLGQAGRAPPPAPTLPSPSPRALL